MQVSTMAAFLLGSVLSGTVRKSQRRCKVTAPKGLTIHPEVVPEHAHARFQAWMQSTPLQWERAVEGRRVLQFGPARFDYALQTVVASPNAPPIPDFLKELFFEHVPAVHRADLVQCIVNEYTSADGIPYHIDDSKFGEHIYVFCMGEARPLLLRRPRATSSSSGSSGDSSSPAGDMQYEEWTAPVSATNRCMYVLSGEARRLWEHSVPSSAGGAASDGNLRVSVTFRSITE